VIRCLAAAIALAALAAPAHADGERVRYGKPVAIVDGVAAGLVGVGVYMIATNDDREVFSGGQLAGAGLVAAGGVTYLLGGPIVHGRRGNRSGAWTSVAIRAALPATGALAGYALDEEREQCDSGGYCGAAVVAPTLTVVGAAAAMAIDWFVLAETEVTPYAAPHRHDGVTAGLAGVF
jgi:hypothetical protein